MMRRERLWGLCVLGGAVLLLIAMFLLLLTENGAWLLSLLRATDVIWEKPRAFGVFHLVWLIFCIFLSVFTGVLGYKKGKESTDRVLLFSGLLFWLLEGYKQLYSFFVINDRVFDFGFFPFQFCSLPLYLFLLLPFLPEGKIKETFYKFIALFGTMGGCLVMGYPRFYDRAALCVHTMLWHTVMIAVGVYVLFARGYGKSWGREVLPAAVPFLTFLSFATLLNVLLPPYALGSPNPLDLYYISPYTRTNYFVIAEVQEVFGWWASLLTYAVLFVFMGATLVFFATALIRFAVKRLQVMCMNLKKSKKEGKI